MFWYIHYLSNQSIELADNLFFFWTTDLNLHGTTLYPLWFWLHDYRLFNSIWIFRMLLVYFLKTYFSSESQRRRVLRAVMVQKVTGSSWYLTRDSPSDDWKTLYVSPAISGYLFRIRLMKQRIIRNGLRLISTLPETQYTSNPTAPRV